MTLSTGVAGLDRILGGGLAEGHVYLVRGEPGTGKTTMALHFLAAGRQRGERAFYLTLSQTAEELRGIARSYGMSLEGVAVEDANLLTQAGETQQTVIRTSELELARVVTAVRARLAETRPDRVVLDSLLDLNLRSSGELAYRRLVRELIDICVAEGCTALFVDSDRQYGGDPQAATLVHGVIALQRSVPGYGIAQRRLEVTKMRGSGHAEGLHDFVIEDDGLRVFPRLSSDRAARKAPSLRRTSSGLAELDELCGGGIDKGTSCMIYGQSGSGKSTLASLLLRATLAGGEAAAAFLFEEHPATLVQRAEALGLPLGEAQREGRLVLHDQRSSEVLPGEFVHRVLDTVDGNQAGILLIDSVNGFLAAATHKDHAFAQLNVLMNTLRSRSIIPVLVVEQAGLMGGIGTTINLSILADSIIMLRQYEWFSHVRRSIAVLKKRSGAHSTEMRELLLEPGRLSVRPISSEQWKQMSRSQLMTGLDPA